MNPYQIIGIQEGASAEQINVAYKQRMAFYASADGDYSAEIEQLNAAYDMLMYQSGSTAGSSTFNSVQFGDIRAKIKEKRFEDAELILDGVPLSDRNAEWYYLKGQILHSRGWLEESADCFAKAYQLDSSNAEYAQAYQQINRNKSGEFRNDWRQNTEQKEGCFGSACKLCTALACCDCLCSFFR